MNTRQGPAIFKRIALFPVLLLISLLFASSVSAAPPKGYFPVPGLMDLRTSFSDGAHSPEDLVTLARLRGFRVLFFNDHHRIKLCYGIAPFRSLLRYGKEFPSIMTHSPQIYLSEIERLSRLYPDMILVPGSIISPFYYWSGSWLSGDLTVHQYDRKILAFNLTRGEDYERLPTLESGLSLTHTAKRLPGLLLFIIPWVIGLLFAAKGKGIPRLIGVVVVILSSLAMVDYNPFRGSTWTPYAGDQGIAPFQETIDYLHERGALAFWNYPEQRSGVRKNGPVNMNTPPYPEVLQECKNYSGFAAIYGDRITATDPGKHWDRALMEYCEGKREKPVWGISTADFHEDGRLGLKLGAFPTTFLVKEFSKAAVLDAVEQGRMYCSRGDGSSWPQIDYFNVVGSNGSQAHMGETLTTAGFPMVKFRISYKGNEKVPMAIHLVRGGAVLQTLNGETPLECELLDEGAPAGRMTYYRLMDSQKHLTSNPIFVLYAGQ
jgi:hypothetical protein